MIKILVLTEDFDAWLQKITSELRGYSIRENRALNTYKIQSDLFYFEIRSFYSANFRGENWSCAILDKYIPHELEVCVLRPCVKQAVIRTKNYQIGLEKTKINRKYQNNDKLPG